MIAASLITWESGTDLVIDTEVDAAADDVWRHIAESELCARWFAPFELLGDERIRFAFDDDAIDGANADGEHADGVSAPLEAEIIACQPGEHVLVAFEGLGRIGITLTFVEADEPGAPEAHAGTRIRITQTFEDAASAAELLPESGPVWETHLRLLCERVGEGPMDVPEHEVYARYAALASQVHAEGAGHDDYADDDADEDEDTAP